MKRQIMAGLDFFPRTIYKQFITKVFMIGDFYNLNLSNKKNISFNRQVYI